VANRTIKLYHYPLDVSGLPLLDRGELQLAGVVWTAPLSTGVLEPELGARSALAQVALEVTRDVQFLHIDGLLCSDLKHATLQVVQEKPLDQRGTLPHTRLLCAMVGIARALVLARELERFEPERKGLELLTDIMPMLFAAAAQWKRHPDLAISGVKTKELIQVGLSDALLEVIASIVVETECRNLVLALRSAFCLM